MRRLQTFFDTFVGTLIPFALFAVLLYVGLIYGFDITDTKFVLIISVGSTFLLSVLFFLVRSIVRNAGGYADLTKELGASPELFLELFKNSPVPYLLVDRHGMIEYPNKSALRLLGVQEGYLEGKNAFNIMDGEDKDHILLIPKKLEKGIYVTNEEVRILRDDSTWRWVNLSAFPFVDRGKQRTLLTLVDITKQKEIDQAKTEFVSLASHQLRTPISSIKWNVELLSSKKTDDLSSRQQSYVEKIERGVHRMDALIQDFLNVSKLELGTYAIQKKQASVIDIIEAIFKEQSEHIESKSLIVNKKYDKSVEMLVTDEKLLFMVISNLVSNAVKYTQEGGTIAVETAGNKRRITLTIEDNGVGIPKAEQEKLFTKLFRASNVRQNMPNGTGLGLYIVKRAVLLLGGDISVESEEGVGTTFTIVLPR